MKTQEYSCPNEFLGQVKEFLMEEEAVNGLPLGIILGLVAAPPVQEPFLAAVTEDAKIRLAMVMTSGHLVLAGGGPYLQPAVAAAATYLARRDLPLSGVIGPREPAELFARLWRPRLPVQVEMEQRIYRLDSVSPVHLSPGRLRLADRTDLDLLAQWIQEFCSEALTEISPEQARQLAESSIAGKAFFLWQDGEAVSMVKKTRPTFNGIALNLVFTPPRFRKRGYATSCVASLCRQLLAEDYKFCCLYTDLANPTSNKIYMDIGFRPVADSVSIKFT